MIDIQKEHIEELMNDEEFYTDMRAENIGYEMDEIQEQIELLQNKYLELSNELKELYKTEDLYSSNEINSSSNLEEMIIKLSKQITKQNTEMKDINDYIKSNTNNKEKITIKEFTAIHKYGDDKQREFRERVIDPLPYLQTKAGGKITYIVKEVDKWLERNNLK